MSRTVGGYLTRSPTADMKDLKGTEKQEDIITEAKRHPGMGISEFCRHLEEKGISSSESRRYVRKVLIRADPTEWYQDGGIGSRYGRVSV